MRLWWLRAELVALFVGVPVILFFYATRWNVHVTLWLFALYSLYFLMRTPEFSWRTLWQGLGWPMRQRQIALLRFIALAPVIVAFTYYLLPERLFRFPIDRPGFWIVVMVLYPLLSVAPQELVFRSFFFSRYKDLLSDRILMMTSNALIFGFSHIMLHNWIAPLFCAIGGLLFAHSYSQHRSLKWAIIEHALYGNFLFTAGLGWYFFVHAPPT